MQGEVSDDPERPFSGGVFSVIPWVVSYGKAMTSGAVE
jgi:hypothetical protein